MLVKSLVAVRASAQVVWVSEGYSHPGIKLLVLREVGECRAAATFARNALSRLLNRPAASV
eukprot:scaffold9928_cov63-Phaeocystis_antarctica.AAC.6